MRVGCIGVGLLLLGFVAYGLYVSWGTLGVAIFVGVVGAVSLVLRSPLKKVNEHNEEPVEKDSRNQSETTQTIGQPILQDPDSLLAQFRQLNMTNEAPATNGDDGLNEAFERAVEEVKKIKHAEDSDRMMWIRTFEQYTERFLQRTQLKTNDPLMKRLNSLFILNGLLYIRVFVNLVEIAVKMERLQDDHFKRLDRTLAGLSKNDYERLNRIIVLHYVDLFLADHTVAIYFNDTFTKRSVTEAVMDGLSFGKQETLLLQAITTDTQYVEVLLGQLRLEADQQLIDLAKTAFENTQPRLTEKLLAEINKG